MASNISLKDIKLLLDNNSNMLDTYMYPLLQNVQSVTLKLERKLGELDQKIDNLETSFDTRLTELEEKIKSENKPGLDNSPQASSLKGGVECPTFKSEILESVENVSKKLHKAEQRIGRFTSRIVDTERLSKEVSDKMSRLIGINSEGNVALFKQMTQITTRLGDIGKEMTQNPATRRTDKVDENDDVDEAGSVSLSEEINDEVMVRDITAEMTDGSQKQDLTVLSSDSNLQIESSSSPSDTSPVVLKNTPSTSSSSQNESTTASTPSTPPNNNLSKMSSRKLVIVGSGNCGKTALIVRLTQGRMLSEFVPTIFENYVKVINTGQESIHLEIYDTAGVEDYDRLRPLSYPQTDVFMICFRVVNNNDFENVTEVWVPEIRHHCSETPIILVGTQKDLRDKSEGCQKPKNQADVITRQQGKELAERIGAFTYIETSALTAENVQDAFEAAIRATFESKKNKKKSNFLAKIDNWLK